MSVPQKPWENQQFPPQSQFTNPGTLGQGRNVLYSHGPQSSSMPPTTTAPIANSQRAPTLPPLPQRPSQLTTATTTRPATMMGPSRFGGYSGYGMGYDPYRGGMAGYGGYNNGAYPMGGGFGNRFLQVAEEGSRDAFQSIESIVHTFTSVSMMLESTYYAMYSSFHAVLGVVDNFSRLRQMFVQFISTITLLRMIRNFYRRLLYWLGVLDHSPAADRIWDAVNGPAEAGAIQPVNNSPKWPLITFCAMLFGGPYLISKFLSNQSKCTWDQSKGRNVRAAFPHQAGSEAELSFQANERLNLAPQEQQPFEESGWMLAVNQHGQVGYIPITRLATKPKADTTPTVRPVTDTATTTTTTTTVQEGGDCLPHTTESH